MKKTNEDFFFNQVKIEITHRCNVSCCFCYLKNRKTRSKEMTYEVFSAVVRRLRSLGIGNVRLSGGEPLTHKNLDQMLSLLFKNKFRIRLITNGDLLTQEFLDKYTKKIYSYHISFHTLESKKLRIIHMMDDSGETYCLNTVINPTSISKIDDYFKHIKDLKCLAQWALLREFPTSQKGEDYKKIYSRSFIKKIQRFNEITGARVAFVNPVPLCVSSPELVEQITEYRCPLLKNTHLTDFTIDCEGTILPCPLLDLKAGNILDSRADIMKIISEIKNKARFSIPEECRICDKFNKCLSGCRAASFIKYGVMDQMDPISDPLNALS